MALHVQGPIDSEIRDLQITYGNEIAFGLSLNHLTDTETSGEKVGLWYRETLCFRNRDERWRIVDQHESVPFYMDGSGRAALDLKPQGSEEARLAVAPLEGGAKLPQGLCFDTLEKFAGRSICHRVNGLRRLGSLVASRFTHDPECPHRYSLSPRFRVLPFLPVHLALTVVLTSKNQTMRGAPSIPGQNPTYEDYARCVHCGLCLNACPTYRLWNLEADSPRGRIHQMIHVSQNEFSATPNGPAPITAFFVDHIDKCLDCRACETACPSAVEYGKLVEHARAVIERDYKRPFFARITREFVFRELLPRPRRIAMLARILRFYQISGLQFLARASGILKLLGLAERERLLPPVDDSFFFSRLGHIFPATGPRRARVAFFAGCVAQVTFTQLNEATIRVLTANGCDVVVPDGQLCCGALAAHAGVREAARDLARNNLAAFARENFDAIITNAAGCGSTLKEYDHLFSTTEPEHKQALAFRSKVRDVTEFLAALGLNAPMQPLKPLTLRVTYQDSCHLLHGQKVWSAPRELLRAIPGVEFVELPQSEICCGSAGIYNVTQTKTSLDLLADKMRHASATEAETIVTANPGCLLQLRAGAELHQTGQEVIHVIELLDRATKISMT
jgi:glycolate oxidase iron-sulfur subunit